MRKAFGILFLLFLIIPFIGAYGWWRMQRQSARRQAKEVILGGVPEESLTLFRFTPEQIVGELEWKHEGEFRYQGKMYDVVRREVLDGEHYLWCWQDDKDSQLSRQLDILIAYTLGHSPQQKNQGSRYTQFYTHLYCSAYNEWADWSLLLQSTPQAKPVLPYTNYSISPPVPPPEGGQYVVALS